MLSICGVIEKYYGSSIRNIKPMFDISKTLVITNLQLLKQIAEDKVIYFGHIKRQNNSIERLFVEGEMEEKRSRGRSRMRWSDNVAHWTQMKITEAEKLIQNRTEWHRRINNALSSVR